MLRLARRHKILSFFALLALALFIYARVKMHGPYRSYRVDREFISANAPSTQEALLVGVGLRDITPDLSQYDAWTDADNDSQFSPKKGDSYADRNKNKKLDLIWLAGFSEKRPAKGINDPLWTRAIALRHQGKTLVLVTIDSIGIMHESFIEIREALKDLAVDHIAFSATHTHNAPDTIGIWSYHRLPLKLDRVYLASVLKKTQEAIREAVANLQPSDVSHAVTEIEPDGFVRDSRKPIIHDRQLCAIRFAKAGSAETLATLVSWGNHPEAMGGDNSLISSDFVHYLREGVEKGLAEPHGLTGLGGKCLFFQGPVGGLMTPLGLTVPDRDGTRQHKDNGVDKARALGENLAIRVVQSLTNSQARKLVDHRLAVVAKTIFVPMSGTYKYPVMLGLVHPGWFDGKARTEVSALRIGEIEILTIPGEIYPEITEGGIESPAGADFPGQPLEVPPLRGEMKGSMKMVFNLANDEIGYIIPKTQWDEKAPYTYGRDSAPYGEVNSGGVDLAKVLHGESLAVLHRLHELCADK